MSRAGRRLAALGAAVAARGYQQLDELPAELDAGGHTTVGQVPAAAVLAELPVAEQVSMQGYDRALFGQRWSDDVRVQGGRNGCDTRNDVLRRDLEGLVVKEGTQGCVALSGTLTDPYTGQRLPFERGQDSGSQIHVDHLVSLANAWATGAQQLDEQTRADFANDPLNLWAVDGAQNQSKGDADAAGWLPEQPAARCGLVVAQIEVKARYGLWVTPAERDAMQQVLTGCSNYSPRPNHTPAP